MAETLLGASEVKLHGREIVGVTVSADSVSSLGGNSSRRQQPKGSGPRLARIYSFSFEGQYYVLPKPAIFLVHGDGVAASKDAGVAARDWEFAPDVKSWAYDKGDFSIRLDVETGPLDKILLEEALKTDHSFAQYGSSRVHLGSSRVHLRNSGDSK